MLKSFVFTHCAVESRSNNPYFKRWFILGRLVMWQIENAVTDVLALAHSTVVTHLNSASAELNNHLRFLADVTIRSKVKIYPTPDLPPAQVVALLRASIDAGQVAVGVVGEPGRAIQRIETLGSAGLSRHNRRLSSCR